MSKQTTEIAWLDYCDRCGSYLRDGICTDYCDALDCSCGRVNLNGDPHEFGPGCDAWDPDLFGDDDYPPAQDGPT